MSQLLPIPLIISIAATAIKTTQWDKCCNLKMILRLLFHNRYRNHNTPSRISFRQSSTTATLQHCNRLSMRHRSFLIFWQAISTSTQITLQMLRAISTLIPSINHLTSIISIKINLMMHLTLAHISLLSLHSTLPSR